MDFQRQLDEIFENVIYRRWAIPNPGQWSPRLDLHETGDAYYVEIDLPDVTPEHVEIRVTESSLTITGDRPASSPQGALLRQRERECGAFRRSLSLPHAVAPDRVQAEYRHGTYRIYLFKKHADRPAIEEQASAEPHASRLIRIVMS